MFAREKQETTASNQPVEIKSVVSPTDDLLTIAEQTGVYTARCRAASLTLATHLIVPPVYHDI